MDVVRARLAGRPGMRAQTGQELGATLDAHRLAQGKLAWPWDLLLGRPSALPEKTFPAAV